MEKNRPVAIIDFFGDVSEETISDESQESLQAFEYFISRILPDLLVTPERFAEILYHAFSFPLIAMSVELLEETKDPEIREYLLTSFEHFEKERGETIYQRNDMLCDALLAELLIDDDEADMEDLEGIDVAHAMIATLDILCRVFPSYAPEHKKYKKGKPDKLLLKLMEPHAGLLTEWLQDHEKFAWSHIAPYLGCFQELHPDYIALQDEGIERFADLYVQNLSLITALKREWADLFDDTKPKSLAIDFHLERECLRIKQAYSILIGNLLAQAFNVPIYNNALGDLGKGTLAELRGNGVDPSKATFSTRDPRAIDFEDFTQTIIHEFCHELQGHVIQENILPDGLDEMEAWQQMGEFFLASRTHGVTKKKEKTLYQQHVVERDTFGFEHRAMQRIKQRLMMFHLSPSAVNPE